VREPKFSTAGAVFTVLVALLATAFAAALVVVGPADDLRYDTGTAGTPGTFTATRCWTTSAGKTDEDHCLGTFTSTDGSVVIQSLELDNTGASVGHPITVRRDSNGTDYHVPSFANSAFDVAVCLGILAFLGLVLARLGFGRSYAAWRRRQREAGPTQPKQRAAYGLPAPWRQLVTVGLWSVVVMLPLAVLAGIVGLIAELF
jgi:hypothetical protein